MIVYLVIPDEVSYERLVLGENARKRIDDTAEGVAGRLASFHKSLEQRLEIINKQPRWKLIPIDATAEIDKVYKAVCENVKANIIYK